jgi:hypothetical protein
MIVFVVLYLSYRSQRIVGEIMFPAQCEQEEKSYKYLNFFTIMDEKSVYFYMDLFLSTYSMPCRGVIIAGHLEKMSSTAVKHDKRSVRL